MQNWIGRDKENRFESLSVSLVSCQADVFDDVVDLASVVFGVTKQEEFFKVFD